jgi:hypothetical protein
LQRAIDEKIKTEAQVVYIIACVRKLIEFENAQQTYPALNFYCNWALHTKLSNSAEASRIVAVFDRAESFLTQVHAAEPGQQISNTAPDWMGELNKEIALENFKSEFQQFCEARNVNGRLLLDERLWLRFLDLYAAVIDGARLISRDDTLQFVKTVTTERVPIPSGMNAAEAGTTYFLAIEWQWKSPSGMNQVTQHIFRHKIEPRSWLHKSWLRIKLVFGKLRYHIFHPRGTPKTGHRWTPEKRPTG